MTLSFLRKIGSYNLRVLMLLAAAASMIPASAWPDTWTTGQITAMDQFPDGGFALRLGDNLVCPELGADWDRRFGVVSLQARGVPGDYTADGVKAMLAQALAAKLSGGAVTVFTVSSNGICWVRQINL